MACEVAGAWEERNTWKTKLKLNISLSQQLSNINSAATNPKIL